MMTDPLFSPLIIISGIPGRRREILGRNAASLHTRRSTVLPFYRAPAHSHPSCLSANTLTRLSGVAAVGVVQPPLTLYYFLPSKHLLTSRIV
jgi:hypothetical protein